MYSMNTTKYVNSTNGNNFKNFQMGPDETRDVVLTC